MRTCRTGVSILMCTLTIHDLYRRLIDSLFSLDAFRRGLKRSQRPPPTGDEMRDGTLIAPVALLEYTPLAVYANAISGALNTLRACAPLTIAPSLMRAFAASLTRIADAVALARTQRCAVQTCAYIVVDLPTRPILNVCRNCCSIIACHLSTDACAACSRRPPWPPHSTVHSQKLMTFMLFAVLFCAY
jgi:hypothetical protein